MQHSAFEGDRSARYAVGEPVKVKYLFPLSGHIRAPFYLRGKVGKIIRYYGLYSDPTELAAGAVFPKTVGLYQLSFNYLDVWGFGIGNRKIEDETEIQILADIYENWLVKDGN